MKGKVTKQKAAVILNCTIRTINRKIIRYKQNDIKGFIHNNCNKKSNQATPKVVDNKILKLRY
ncbi:hypothetical protein [Mesoplasma corruscae]|uniref:hypothetical protein n=1 Tax=Mesoplasma corruscae TaxID=216874 RepID=UPI000CE599AB|nr:hypothetical protein [Mesoplasma corruscae]